MAQRSGDQAMSWPGFFLRCRPKLGARNQNFQTPRHWRAANGFFRRPQPCIRKSAAASACVQPPQSRPDTRCCPASEAHKQPGPVCRCRQRLRRRQGPAGRWNCGCAYYFYELPRVKTAVAKPPTAVAELFRSNRRFIENLSLRGFRRHYFSPQGISFQSCLN